MRAFDTYIILLVIGIFDYISTAATTTFPKSTGTVTYSKARVLTGNEVFDGALKRFDRGSKFLRHLYSSSMTAYILFCTGGSCQNQKEGGEADAVFILESGATLKNVIIGANQAEGNSILSPCN